jgi:hypothetical protein
MANEDLNLSALLREVETEHLDGDVEDLLDLRSQLVAAVGVYRTSRYRLGETLYAYRTALPYGAWTPVVKAIASASHLTDRTTLFSQHPGADFKTICYLVQAVLDQLQKLQEVRAVPTTRRQPQLLSRGLSIFFIGRMSPSSAHPEIVQKGQRCKDLSGLLPAGFMKSWGWSASGMGTTRGSAVTAGWAIWNW